jgi:hypothetical protein
LIEGVRSGTFGHHWSDLTSEALLKGLKVCYSTWKALRATGIVVNHGMQLLFIYETIYVAAATAIKFAIGVFLLRFCMERYHRWIIYAIFVLITCLAMFTFVSVLVQCQPPSWFWNQAIDSNGSCNGKVLVKAGYVHSAITALSDAALGLLPILLVRSLHLPPYVKAYVVVILALGSWQVTLPSNPPGSPTLIVDAEL